VFSRFWVEQGIDGLSLNADRLLRMRQVVRGQEDGVYGLFLMRTAMLRLAGVACHPMSHAGEM